MILRTLACFTSFQCIGGACKNSCCIGWELVIDEATYQYYQDLPGDFGDTLRSKLTDMDTFSDKEEATFHLTVNGRCPFLNHDGWCEIVKHLGEEALCDVCAEYPRYSFSYGNITEKSLTLSCEEAARLWFTHPDVLTVQEHCLSEDSPMEVPCDASMEAPAEVFTDMEHLRHLALTEIFHPNWPGLDDPEILQISFAERLHLLTKLEILNDDWISVLNRLLTICDGDVYKTYANQFLSSCHPIKDYQRLLVYFLYRYFPMAYYDFNPNGKLRFAYFCVQVIRDLDILSFYEHHKEFSFQDRIRNVTTFCREVEHSQENLDILMEELLFWESV